MIDWLTGSYMVLKIAAVVFCTLFFINWVSILSSQKMGKIPLGDFIIIGLVLLLVLHNRAGLVSLAQCVPDGISLITKEVDARTGGIKRGVLEVKKDATEIYSAVKAITNGEVAEQIHLGIKYQLPE